MQSNIENSGLQDLSNKLINKTKEYAQLLEAGSYDSNSLRDILIEIANLREVMRAYWEKQKKQISD